MRITRLRAGDRFVFDEALLECCAVGDAVVTDSGIVLVIYEDGREVRSRTFNSSVEVDLVSRVKVLP